MEIKIEFNETDLNEKYHSINPGDWVFWEVTEKFKIPARILGKTYMENKVLYSITIPFEKNFDLIDNPTGGCLLNANQYSYDGDGDVSGTWQRVDNVDSCFIHKMGFVKF